MPRTILLVDDNRDAVEVLRLLLESEGHVVETALSGEAALAIAARFAPNVAFIDWRLPGLDGPNVVAHLKAMPALAQTRFVALSGYGGPDMERTALDAGFEALITKPVLLEQLSVWLQDAAPR